MNCIEEKSKFLLEEKALLRIFYDARYSKKWILIKSVGGSVFASLNDKLRTAICLSILHTPIYIYTPFPHGSFTVKYAI